MNRVCKLGHKVHKETDKELKKEYPYVCLDCDENMYKFETFTKEEYDEKFNQSLME